jgi:hypothetical protein
VGIRQRPQKDTLNHGKDRGIRPDPKRKAEDGESRHSGTFAKLAQSVAQVIEQIWHAAPLRKHKFADLERNFCAKRVWQVCDVFSLGLWEFISLEKGVAGRNRGSLFGNGQHYS